MSRFLRRARWCAVAVLILWPSAYVHGAEPPPAARTNAGQTITVLGSSLERGKWRSTHIPVTKGQTVTFAATPLEGLNAPAEYRRDAVIFRLGHTGAEIPIDSKGRAPWHPRKKKQLVFAPERTIVADVDGEIWYMTNQDAKMAVKIVVQ